MNPRHLLFAALLAVPALALANPPQPPPPGANGPGPDREHDRDGERDLARDWPRVAASLGLDAAQQSTIEELFFAAQKDGIELRAAADRAGLDLRRALGADQPDAGAVKKAFTTHAKADSDLKWRRVQLMLDLRGVLTVEQWRSFLAMRGERR